MELPKVLCILACLMSPGLSFSVLPAYVTVPDSTCFLASAFLLCAATRVKVLQLRIAIVRRGADAHLSTQNMLSICIEIAKRLIQCCRFKQLRVVLDLLNEVKGFMYAVEHHCEGKLDLSQAALPHCMLVHKVLLYHFCNASASRTICIGWRDTRGQRNTLSAAQSSSIGSWYLSWYAKAGPVLREEEPFGLPSSRFVRHPDDALLLHDKSRVCYCIRHATIVARFGSATCTPIVRDQGMHAWHIVTSCGTQLDLLLHTSHLARPNTAWS